MFRLVTAVAVFAVLPGMAQAVTIETVPVGNLGNSGELSGISAGTGGFGPDAIVGGVPYTYNIGKYEVTAGQYTEFLNAVADTDSYDLYSINMWWSDYGCKIERNGTSGSYTYSVKADRASRPVNYVSWGDAARFCNWLSNGQPTGAQGTATTEDGSYYLNGATSREALMAVTRKAGATWVIPTEDEWYKAAYHENDGVTGNYWDYPTGTNSVPNNGNPPGPPSPADTGNTANYWDGDYTLWSPYYTTAVGYFNMSDSSYGTFDQGGNLWEWNETAIEAGLSRGLRGGSYGDGNGDLLSSHRGDYWPTDEHHAIGFRVASIPEPSFFMLLGSAGIVFAGCAWRRQWSR